MAQTVVGLFDNFQEAQSVVNELESRGFKHDDISIVANNASGEYSAGNDNSALGNKENVGDRKMNNNAPEQAGSGALAGAGVGAGLGLLAGLAALAIPGIGPVIAAGPIAAALGAGGATVAGATAIGAGLGAASGALVGPLVEAGVPRPEAELYNEGVRRGGALVVVRADDRREAEEAADIMSRYNVIDIDERGDNFRSGGWKYDENAQPYTNDQISTFRTNRTTTTSGTVDRNVSNRNNLNTNEEAVLPVVEEQLQVGKRQVERGGARIHTKITEQPVEEQVNLHEEHVHVERRPVNRDITDADANAFRDQTIEVRETAEEPVVAKRARVIEEVVVRKEATDRTETVRDTVRRQDVHVHEDDNANVTSGTTTNTNERAIGGGDYSAFDNDFRTHYQSNYANTGMDYDSYSPVYRYGYNLANDSRYRDADWSTVESDARSRWEERNPGTWDQFKDGVRYAWDKARGRR